MAPFTEYEIQRQKNIAANLAILASLGLERPAQAVSRPKAVRQPKPRPQPKAQPKRKAAEVVAPEQEEAEAGGRRKSARIVAAAKRKAKKTTQSSDSDSDSSVQMSDLASDEEDGGPKGRYNDGDRPGLPRRMVNGRYVAHLDPKWTRPDPKTFGPTPNVPVGTWWAMRQEASLAGVHGPWVAGISGSAIEGAYSVALSGGYEDDIDEGFRFTFTGEGGRELKKDNLRTAPQSKDQVLSKGNAALVKSFETGKPIRVIRGFKGDKKWAPKTGYRYDGLYTVMKWWEDKGMAGYKVFKFAFKRVDGQEPIDLNAGPPAESEDEESEEEDRDKSEEVKEETPKAESDSIELEAVEDLTVDGSGGNRDNKGDGADDPVEVVAAGQNAGRGGKRGRGRGKGRKRNSS